MARVAVITSNPLFSEGGNLVHARGLVNALREFGHEADLVLTPQNRFGRQGGAYLAAWLTDVGMGQDGRPVDQVITLRYPSYAVRHPAHVCWLNHTMREYYDLWDRFTGGISGQGRLKEGVRRKLIHAADRYFLSRHVSKLFAISKTVVHRLEKWGSLKAEALYIPPLQRAYRCDRYGDYIFAVSRLTPLKRFDLLVRALAQPLLAGARCAIAGEGEEAPALQKLARELGVSDRLQFLGRIDEAALLKHLGECRAVCFPTLDEDYGFVTVEAFASRKAVITCRDSGGPAEIVTDGVNGFVTEPSPEALATSMSTLLSDERQAAKLGGAGCDFVKTITWETAINRLVIV